MSDFENIDYQESDIKCIDDAPESARLITRQQLLMRRCKWIAVAPIVALFISDKYWSDGSAKTVFFTIAMVWAMGCIIYTLYLTITVRCPRCKNRFGLGENCRTCLLPKHRKLNDSPAEAS